MIPNNNSALYSHVIRKKSHDYYVIPNNNNALYSHVIRKVT